MYNHNKEKIYKAILSPNNKENEYLKDKKNDDGKEKIRNNIEKIEDNKYGKKKVMAYMKLSHSNFSKMMEVYNNNIKMF